MRPCWRKFWRYWSGHDSGADRHTDLMGGTALAPGGTARRQLPPEDADPETRAEADRWMRAKRNLQAQAPMWLLHQKKSSKALARQVQRTICQSGDRQILQGWVRLHRSPAGLDLSRF